jgi:hypothetical protein
LIRLAAHYGRTPEELGRALSSTDIAELVAFDNLYGFPDIYFLAALICSTLEGLWSTRPRPIDKILPYFAAGRPGQSVEEMAARVRMMSQRNGKQAQDASESGQ